MINTIQTEKITESHTENLKHLTDLVGIMVTVVTAKIAELISTNTKELLQIRNCLIGKNMNWLRKKLKQWLGINNNEANIETLFKLHSDLTNIGIDVHFKSPHMVIIFSKLKGGQIRHIDIDLKDMGELNELAKHLKERYRPQYIFYDTPRGTNKNWLP